MTKEKLSNHRIEVCWLGSGWAAIHTVEVTDERGTYRDVQQTGIGRYLTMAEAMVEASMWSKSDEIPLYTPGVEPEAAPPPAPGHFVIFTEEERKLLAEYHRTSDMVECRLDREEQAELNRMSELWKGIQAKLEPTPATADTETTDLYSARTPEDGVIRLAKWPEGYVLWHHGKIVWRSWETKPAKGPKVLYLNKVTGKWHRLVSENDGGLLTLERVGTRATVYLGREQFELRFSRWVEMPS